MSIETEILIFLHIPKVGGMTLSKILERHYSPAQTLNFDAGDNQQTRFEAIPAPQRARSRLIKGHLFFGLHRCIEGPSVYVTFLREPIEREILFVGCACVSAQLADQVMLPSSTFWIPCEELDALLSIRRFAGAELDSANNS